MEWAMRLEDNIRLTGDEETRVVGMRKHGSGAVLAFVDGSGALGRTAALAGSAPV